MLFLGFILRTKALKILSLSLTDFNNGAFLLDPHESVSRILVKTEMRRIKLISMLAKKNEFFRESWTEL